MNQIEAERKIRQISSIGQIFMSKITGTISITRERRAKASVTTAAPKNERRVGAPKKTAQERIPCAEYNKIIEKPSGKTPEFKAKVEKNTQSAKLFCRKMPDRSPTRASRARPRLNNWRTEGALSPIASAISAELHPSACSSTTLRDSVPKAESARDHRASSTRA